MIVYQVNIAIHPARAPEWLDWMLGKHIPDVIKTGYLTGWQIKQFLRAENDTSHPHGWPQKGWPAYCIEYLCANRSQLDEYLAQAAPCLQQDHCEKFNGTFMAWRRILISAPL